MDINQKATIELELLALMLLAGILLTLSSPLQSVISYIHTSQKEENNLACTDYEARCDTYERQNQRIDFCTDNTSKTHCHDLKRK